MSVQHQGRGNGRAWPGVWDGMRMHSSIAAECPWNHPFFLMNGCMHTTHASSRNKLCRRQQQAHVGKNIHSVLHTCMTLLAQVNEQLCSCTCTHGNTITSTQLKSRHQLVQHAPLTDLSPLQLRMCLSVCFTPTPRSPFSAESVRILAGVQA